MPASQTPEWLQAIARSPSAIKGLLALFIVLGIVGFAGCVKGAFVASKRMWGTNTNTASAPAPSEPSEPEPSKSKSKSKSAPTKFDGVTDALAE